MQYNRKLRISMAGSRKANYWPSADIMWSEFAEKLKTPVRGAETLDEYMSWPKPRQDEAKDVGGFVGGFFTNGRRKPCYLEGRDLILSLIHI